MAIRKIGVFGSFHDTETIDLLPARIDIRDAFIEKTKTVGSGTSGGRLSVVSNYTIFHKVMFDGRILYIPTTPYISATSSTSLELLGEIIDTFQTAGPVYLEKLGRKYELKLGSFAEYCAFMTPTANNLGLEKVNQLPKDITIYTQVTGALNSVVGVPTYFSTSDKLITYVGSTDILTISDDLKPKSVSGQLTTFMCYLELIRE